jgi:hypothetical protein
MYCTSLKFGLTPSIGPPIPFVFYLSSCFRLSPPLYPLSLFPVLAPFMAPSSFHPSSCPSLSLLFIYILTLFPIVLFLSFFIPLSFYQPLLPSLSCRSISLPLYRYPLHPPWSLLYPPFIPFIPFIPLDPPLLQLSIFPPSLSFSAMHNQ